MASQPNPIPVISSETARAAMAVFSPANFYIQLGEHLVEILKDIQLEGPANVMTTPKVGEAILPLIIFFQFVESLNDTQAVDAVRSRIDWKFALHLPINPPPFKESSLCQFRRMVITDPSSQREFQKLIDRLLKLGPSINGQTNSFEYTEVLFAVCSANRLNWALQGMRHAIEALVSHYPDWLRQVALPHWYGRYNDLSIASASSGQRRLSIKEISADIHYLIVEMIRSGNREMNELQEVKSLYRTWIQQFEKSNKFEPDRHGSLTLKDCETCFKNAG